jgi:hypothetical protein
MVPTNEINAPNPANLLYVCFRYPRYYRVRQFIAWWFLAIGYRIGGFKGMKLERDDS